MTGASFSQHSHGGTCHVCGAHAMTVARFHHKPSNTYVEVGETCAQKLDGGDPIDFRSFRKRIAAGLNTLAGKARAQQLLTAAGLPDAWTLYQEGDENELPENAFRAFATVCDVVGTVVRTGRLSEKQAGFLGVLLRRIAEAPQIAAQREAEREAAEPVPTEGGRQRITGRVLSTKEVDGAYGFQVKMLVRDNRGFKVWGTMPGSIDANAGDAVSFMAKLQPSADDAKFGFFIRPTKATILEPGAK